MQSIKKKENEIIKLRTCAKLLQLCPTLCSPMYCSLPGSSVHGIPQIRMLEWVAVPFSRGSSQPGNQTPRLLYLLLWQEGSLPLALHGKPQIKRV